MKLNNMFKVASVFFFLIFVAALFLFEEAREVSVSSLLKVPMTILIDAGHGGEDGGAVGLGGVLEKEINLDVAVKVEKIMNLCGVNTDMLRRRDESLSSGEGNTVRERKVSDIKKRVEKVKNTPAATLISIHQNSFPEDIGCKGAQVFYSEMNIKSKDLAEYVQASLKNGINKDNRRKEKKSDKSIYLLDNVNCPAILIECGFLTNPEEVALLKTKEYQKKLAVCIAAGFFNYIVSD